MNTSQTTDFESQANGSPNKSRPSMFSENMFTSSRLGTPDRARSPGSSTIFSSEAGPRLGDYTSPSVRTPPRPFHVSTRGIIIKADPTLSTTFDPADKELYHLWAPAR